MKISTVLLIGGAGYLAYKMWAQSTAAGQLKYFVKSINYGESTLGYTVLNATLTVDNPSNQNLRFNKFFCRILVNGSELANTTIVDTGTPTILKPGQTDLIVPIRVGHLSALQTLASVIEQIVKKQPIEQPVTITGLLYAAGLQIPVTQTMTITPTGIKGIGYAAIGKGEKPRRQMPLPQKQPVYTPKHKGYNGPVIGTIGNCEFCVSGVLN